MKQLIACTLLCALCLSLAACSNEKEPIGSSSSPSSATERQTFRVAVVFAEEDAYAAQLLAGAQAAANESDADITFDVNYAGGSKVKERELLDALNPKETQGVLCFPVSADESIARLDRVTERGIPVSIVGVENESTAFAASAIASDAYELGNTVGDEARKYLESTLSGKANIAVIQHNTENLVESTLRQNGFFDALEDMENVKVVGMLDLSSGGGKPQDRVAAFLKDHNDIDVIFCTTGQELAAVQEAVVTAKYTAALFGVDAYQDVINIMRSPENTIQAIAAQDYFAIGQSAMASLIGTMTGSSKDESPPSAPSPILLRAGDEEALANFEERLA